MTGKPYVQGNTTKIFMHNVKSLREQSRMTLAKLSELLEQEGQSINPIGLTRMEQGKRVLRLDEALALSRIFGIELKLMCDANLLEMQKERVLSWLLAETQYQRSAQQ